jgi:diguanylate cyclase (GGDEF)-like protein
MKITYRRDSGPMALSCLGAIPPLASLLLLALGLGFVFGLDHRTGEAPIQHLYYIPLVFAALRFGAAGGLMTAAAAVLLYHLANTRLLDTGYRYADFLQILIFIALPLLSAKLADDARRLRQLASADDLTGLSNLRGFEDALADLVRKARACGGTISMLVVDVDRLKSLNDSYGHLTGADAVRTVGRIVADVLPPTAAACRYGGDEFAIAVQCDTAEARHLAEVLVRRVRQTAAVLAGSRMSAGTLSVSIGVASRVFESGESPRGSGIDDGEALFHAADQALYVAKGNGRGRAAVAE